MADIIAQAAVRILPDLSVFQAQLQAGVTQAVERVKVPPVRIQAQVVGASGTGLQEQIRRTAQQATRAVEENTDAISRQSNVLQAAGTRAGDSAVQRATREEAAAKRLRAVEGLRNKALERQAILERAGIGAISQRAAAQAKATASTALLTAATTANDAAVKTGDAALIKSTQSILTRAQALNTSAIAEQRAAVATAEHAAAQSQATRGALATAASFGGLRGAVLAASAPFLAATVAVTAFAKALGSAAALQDQINVFRATTGATAEQLERVAAAARELGRDTTLAGVTAGDAAQTFTELAKAGLSVNDALAGGRGVLQLAIAAQLDFAEASELAANALNAFGLAGDQAERVADVFANAANAAQGSIADVGIALRQAAAVANQVGVSFEDTTALLALLAKNGLTGSDAGTSLRTALIRLINPGREATTVIEALGIQIRDAQGNIRPDVFAQFGEATKDLPPALRDAAAATVFGQDAIRAVAIAAREGSEGLRSMQEFLDRQGTAAEVAGARMQGLSGALQGLSNVLTDVGTAFASVLIPPLTLTLKAVTALVPAISVLGGVLAARFVAAKTGAAAVALSAKAESAYAAALLKSQLALAGVTPAVAKRVVLEARNANAVSLMTKNETARAAASARASTAIAQEANAAKAASAAYVQNTAALAANTVAAKANATAQVAQTGFWKLTSTGAIRTAASTAEATASLSRIGAVVSRTTAVFATLGRGLLALAGGPVGAVVLGVGALAFGLFKLINTQSAVERANARLGESFARTAEKIKVQEDAARALDQALKDIDFADVARRQAEISVAQARQALAQSTAAAGTLERTQLEVSLRQAELDLAAAIERVNQAEQDKALAQEKSNIATRTGVDATAEHIAAINREAQSFVEANRVIERALEQRTLEAERAFNAQRAFNASITADTAPSNVSLAGAETQQRLAEASKDAIDKFTESLRKQSEAALFNSETNDDIFGKNLALVAEFVSSLESLDDLSSRDNQIAIRVILNNTDFRANLDQALKGAQATVGADVDEDGIQRAVAAVRALLVREGVDVGTEFSLALSEAMSNFKIDGNDVRAVVAAVQQLLASRGIEVGEAFANQVSSALTNIQINDADVTSVIRQIGQKLRESGAAVGKDFATNLAKSLAGLSPRDALAAVSSLLAQVKIGVGKKGLEIGKDLGKALADGLIESRRQALQAARETLAEVVREGERQIADAQERVRNVIAQGKQQVSDALSQARQNLQSLGESITATALQFIDISPLSRRIERLKRELQVLRDEGRREDLRRAQRDALQDLQSAQRRFRLLPGTQNADQLRVVEEALQPLREALADTGRDIETFNKEGILTGLEATLTAQKRTVEEGLREIIDGFLRGTISLQDVNKRIAGVLRTAGLKDWQNTGGTLGKALADRFGEQLSAVKAQAASITQAIADGITAVDIRIVDVQAAAREAEAAAKRAKDELAELEGDIGRRTSEAAGRVGEAQNALSEALKERDVATEKTLKSLVEILEKLLKPPTKPTQRNNVVGKNNPPPALNARNRVAPQGGTVTGDGGG